MSCHEASRLCGVPRTTLRTKLEKGEDVLKPKGFKKVFTNEEESGIVQYICEAEEVGNPRARKDITEGARGILQNFPRENRFKENLPGSHWCRNFMKRNPQLTSRKPEALPPASSCITAENWVKWWLETDDLFKKNGYIEILKDPIRRPYVINSKEYVVYRGQIEKEKHIKELTAVKQSEQKQAEKLQKIKERADAKLKTDLEKAAQIFDKKVSKINLKKETKKIKNVFVL